MKTNKTIPAERSMTILYHSS